MSKKRFNSPKSGAQILVQCLEELKVKHIFGYPGGANLPIYDVLTRSKIEVILSGDERCAGHAAEGYARATGKVGVCLVTSGPGATNLVTPLADAKMDSTPIVGISGQVSSAMIGKDAFQETPIQNITTQITKHNYLVTKTGDIARVIHEAFYIAASGRPGPVLVDITKDAQQNTVTEIDKTFKLRGYNPEVELDSTQLENAAEEIAKAKRPFIYGGQGLILGEATAELREFVRKTGIPVGLTVLGLGAFPATDPLFTGMLGMHGAACANYAIHEADLVIALGARFDDRITGNAKEFVKAARIIHVDVDAAEINKNKEVQVPVTGQLKDVLRELTKIVKKSQYPEWVARIHELKTKFPLRYKQDTSVIKPQYFLERLYALTKGKAVLTTGVGQHQMWAAQYYKYDRPRTFITSAGAGTMGFGLPSAVGAKLGCPEELVIDIDGDGSFEMNINEMRTISDRNLGVKVVVINNKLLGMVGQWQRAFYAKNYSSSEFKDYPDFTNGIKALYGIPTKRITKYEEVDEGIKEMIKGNSPFLLEVMIPKEEDVHPMIPAGGTIKDMILG